MARADQVDVVYIATNVSDREDVSKEYIEALGDSTVSMYLVPNFYTAEIMQGNWVTVGDTPTVTFIDTPTLGIDSWVKRAEDISYLIRRFAAIGDPYGDYWSEQ